jgi:hypothetical protein
LWQVFFPRIIFPFCDKRVSYKKGCVPYLLFLGVKNMLEFHHVPQKYCYQIIQHRNPWTRVLMMVYNTQNYWFFALFLLSSILETRKHDFGNWIYFRPQLSPKTQ